jgi:hypothetical protein
VAKIFIGGSVQALPLVREVEAWLSEAQHEVVSWDSAAFFNGDYTLEYLQQSAELFDAGLFIFSEEDRQLEERESGRDKALAEFGVFTGTHGKQRALICFQGKRRPSDLVGVTYVDISPEKSDTGRRKLERWGVGLGSQPRPKVVRHGGDVAEIIKRFPIESYKIKLQRSEFATILDMYLPAGNHFDLIESDLVTMLENGGRVQILLCDPASSACTLRQPALHDVDVSAEIERSLEHLRRITAQLPAEARDRIQLRLYSTLPSVSSYRVDDMVIGGCNFHGTPAIDGPQFRTASTGSLLGERLVQEHGTLWEHPQTRSVSLV